MAADKKGVLKHTMSLSSDIFADNLGFTTTQNLNIVGSSSKIMVRQKILVADGWVSLHDTPTYSFSEDGAHSYNYFSEPFIYIKNLEEVNTKAKQRAVSGSNPNQWQSDPQTLYPYILLGTDITYYYDSSGDPQSLGSANTATFAKLEAGRFVFFPCKTLGAFRVKAFPTGTYNPTSVLIEYCIIENIERPE